MNGHAGIARGPGWRRHLWVGLAGSALVHATLMAIWWQAAPRRDPPQVGHTAARVWLQVARAPAVQLPAVTRTGAKATIAAPAPPKRRGTAVERSTKPVAAAMPDPPLAALPTATAVASAQPIDGSVFAMPNIGFAPHARSAPKPFVAATPRTIPTVVPMMARPAAAQAQAIREAARAQIAAALRGQAESWPTPIDATQGACDLLVHPQQRLECDDPGLRQIIEPRMAALAGLTLAYRRLDADAHADGVSIRTEAGGYRLAIRGQAPANQSSTASDDLCCRAASAAESIEVVTAR